MPPLSLARHALRHDTGVLDIAPADTREGETSHA